MKIRIQRNSIRFRLSKTEVGQLAEEGNLTEETSFGKSIFTYQVMQNADRDSLWASFEDGKITLEVPSAYLEDWAINEIVGFDSKMETGGNESLTLLIEKDFKCIDNTTEDQSDHYENPKKSC